MRRTLTRRGFTLIEILVALTVGLMVLQFATVSFLAIQRSFDRIQRRVAETEVTQAAVLWAIAMPEADPASFAREARNNRLKQVGIAASAYTPGPGPAWQQVQYMYVATRLYAQEGERDLDWLVLPVTGD